MNAGSPNHFPPDIIMFSDYLDALIEIIKDRFSVLHEGYLDDLLIDLKKDAEQELEDSFTVRYVLVDGETGQLESRTLFLSQQAAEDAAKESAHGKSCRVGIVLVEN